jgi:hypothetical protein
LMNNEDVSLSWERALRFAADVAAGVNALHTWKPPILHRDVKVSRSPSLKFLLSHLHHVLFRCFCSLPTFFLLNTGK